MDKSSTPTLVPVPKRGLFVCRAEDGTLLHVPMLRGGAPDLSFPPSDIEFDACDDPEGVRADCEAALAASVK
jgi:hypothetical protein